MPVIISVRECGVEGKVKKGWTILAGHNELWQAVTGRRQPEARRPQFYFFVIGVAARFASFAAVAA